MNTLELQADAFGDGARVVIHDDVLATGGTARALAELVEQLGGEVVGLQFIIELDFLKGQEKILGLRRLFPLALLTLAVRRADYKSQIVMYDALDHALHVFVPDQG